MRMPLLCTSSEKSDRGPMVEENLRRALLAAAALLLIVVLLPSVKAKREEAFVEE